jgi:hypothetical protein
MSESDSLPVPDDARKDPRSFELLRVWVANNDQHVSLQWGAWEDPAAWGIMLSDLMHHIANAYHQDRGLDLAATLERIKAGLQAELSSPTDDPSGHQTA